MPILLVRDALSRRCNMRGRVMTQTLQTLMLDQWHISIVVSLIDFGDTFQVSFQGGMQAIVSVAHPEWQTIRQWLSFSLRRRCPVGILLGEGNQLVQAGMI